MIFLTAILMSTLSHAAIIDGEAVALGDHPAVFGLKLNYSETGSFTSAVEGACTAFLVAPDLLLTAAHCLGKDVTSIELIANGSDLTRRKTQGVVVNSDGFKSHPQFALPAPGMSQVAMRKNAGIDIAYITLDHPVTGIKPIPVYMTTDAASKKALRQLEATLVGYGATKFIGTDGDYSSVATHLVKHQGKKQIKYETNDGSLNYIILEGEKNGALPGDSGGPEIVTIDGAAKVVAINHGMQGKSITTTRVIKRGKNKGQTETKTETNPKIYGFTIGTLLTKANLCWVESESKVEIPGVDCSK